MSKGLRLGIALGAIALAVGALLLLPAVFRLQRKAALDHPSMKKVASQLLDHPQVELDGKQYKVELVGPHNLHRVTFEIKGHTYEAIEQNPDKDTEWAKLAREAHKVVQFKDVAGKRYIGVVVDGEVRDTSSSAAD